MKVELELANKQIFNLYVEINLDDLSISSKVAEDEHYEEEIYNCLLELRSNSLESNSNSQSSSSVVDSNNRKLNLPKIELPTFSNDKDDNFQKFITSLEYFR